MKNFLKIFFGVFIVFGFLCVIVSWMLEFDFSFKGWIGLSLIFGCLFGFIFYKEAFKEVRMNDKEQEYLETLTEHLKSYKLMRSSTDINENIFKKDKEALKWAISQLSETIKAEKP